MSKPPGYPFTDGLANSMQNAPAHMYPHTSLAQRTQQQDILCWEWPAGSGASATHPESRPQIHVLLFGFVKGKKKRKKVLLYARRPSFDSCLLFRVSVRRKRRTCDVAAAIGSEMFRRNNDFWLDQVRISDILMMSKCLNRAKRTIHFFWTLSLLDVSHPSQPKISFEGSEDSRNLICVSQSFLLNTSLWRQTRWKPAFLPPWFQQKPGSLRGHAVLTRYKMCSCDITKGSVCSFSPRSHFDFI